MTRRQRFILRLSQLGGALLMPGLFLPIFHVQKLLIIHDNFSIVGGAMALAKNDEKLLAVLLFTFGVIVPLLKVFALVKVAKAPDNVSVRRAIAVMHRFSRWSFLDVMAVATLVAVFKSNALPLVSAFTMPGLYPFLGAVILLAIATELAAGIKLETNEYAA